MGFFAKLVATPFSKRKADIHRIAIPWHLGSSGHLTVSLRYVSVESDTLL